MQLRKTIITLFAIKDLMLDTFEVNKVLIIAPLRVARDTWPTEIEKWDHLKGLDISVIVGDVKTRIAAVHHPAMIYVVNRENIKRILISADSRYILNTHKILTIQNLVIQTAGII